MNNFVRRLDKIALFGTVATLVLAQTSAHAAEIPFSILGTGVSATGTLLGNYVTLSGFADTVFAVTGATGSYSDATDGLSGTITGVLPGKIYTSIPSTANHDSVDATGVMFPPASYDNILYPNGNSPVVCNPVFYPYFGGKMDIFGLMLTLNLQGGGSGLVNVWSNGELNDPSNPLGLDYGLSDGTLDTVNGSPLYQVRNYVGDSNSYPNYSGSGLQFSAVPEPGALLLLGAGIAALPMLGLRRKKQA